MGNNQEIFRDWAARMWRGRQFQSLGAATAKALSPLVFSLDPGTSNSSWSADCGALEGDVVEE